MACFVDRARLAYSPPVDAEVTFRPSGKQVRVPVGTTILDAARRVGLPVASACAAHGLCGRCGVTVLSGASRVSAETPRETEAKRANRTEAKQRLSCMTTISGDVEITASYW
jgi:uncharacterized 2Fe-2S/4Fe-4S cluster protein (DUF4445 family)